MKLPVLQETDWIKRGLHQQHHLMDRMAPRGYEVHVLDRGFKYRCQGIFNGDNESLKLAIVPGTYIPGVPCVTLRDNTERPETVEAGSNVLAGADPNRILECTELMLTKEKGWKNPFGDGMAGKKIMEILTKQKFVSSAGD